MSGKALVLDANILVRAVLGKRTRKLIEVIRRGGDSVKAMAFLDALGRIVEMVGREVYGEFEAVARERLTNRDPEDWPTLATAFALGCGVATWTSDRVEMFLRE
jgi:predicted nucleic acid-binding protein